MSLAPLPPRAVREQTRTVTLSSAASDPSIGAMIAELKREYETRRVVFPRLVRERRLTEEEGAERQRRLNGAIMVLHLLHDAGFR